MQKKPIDRVYPRVARMRERTIGTTPEIFTDRAVLVTESYRHTQGQTNLYRKAKALENVLLHMQICIAEDELVVGSYAGRPRGCQLYPEYDLKYVVDELDTFSERTADRFYVSEENKRVIREIYEFWKGNSLTDTALRLFSKEQRAYAEDLVYALTALRSGVGHVIVDYRSCLQKGLYAVMREADALQEALDPGDPRYMEKLDYYQAVSVSAKSAVAFAERFAALADQMADGEADAQRREELREIAENCRRVPAYPAQSFYQALQSFWFIHLVIHLESNGHSISPGRFDQYMYPYFRADIDSGTISKAFAEELLQTLWIKFFELNKVRDKVMSVAFGGYPMFQNLMVGGQDIHGRSAVNELSHLILDTTYKVGLPQPSLSIRWFYGCPPDFFEHALRVAAQGYGLPAMFNDEVLIPNMLQLGYSLDEARDYAIVGCTETTGQGNNEPWLTGGFLNILKILELTLFGGYDAVAGKQYDLDVGPVEQTGDFEEFFAAYLRQVDYFLDHMVACDNILDALHGHMHPTPFESIFIQGCMENGRTSLQGGAKYNHTSLQMVGIANVADALLSIKALVYDDHSMTWDQMKTALRQDFEGREDVRQTMLRLPKYGMDDARVDEIGQRIVDHIEKTVQKYRSPRGGGYNFALYSIASHVLFAGKTAATPDGRHKFALLADGGVSCSHGSDREGLTALLNSVTGLDPYKARGSTLLNVKLNPNLFEGDNFSKTATVIRTYFLNKGQHIQFNVVDSATLRDAQKHPENYPMLTVRVAGFSVLFTTIDPLLQNDIIARTEHDSRG
ncbi:MAG TPA: formate C-acetyltransferase/glycerol dehydratase family glycyl radical enzyme [Feifaniaceae bacterium]|nr:formate C-acetyltransferase/glycerol dehydratase family glycyl radical enzyme [Feifaniaceae bacterium]